MCDHSIDPGTAQSTWLGGKETKHQRCSHTTMRLHRLDLLNLTSHLRDAHLTMKRDCVASETKQALRAFLASESELADLHAEAASEAPMTAADFSHPLNPENEMAVFKILLEAVIDAQNAMPGSLEADSDLLSGEQVLGGGMGEEERMAVLFRREKRKVIAHAREKLEYNTEMKWLLDDVHP